MDPVRISSSLPSLVESEAASSAVKNEPQGLLKPVVSSAFEPSNEGQAFQPSVGDEVLVSFEHGDMSAPYLIGSLWNSTTPPTNADGLTKENGASAPPPAGALDPASGQKDNRWLDEQVKLIGRHLKP
jgi:hypothetical protein